MWFSGLYLRRQYRCQLEWNVITILSKTDCPSRLGQNRIQFCSLFRPVNRKCLCGFEPNGIIFHSVFRPVQRECSSKFRSNVILFRFVFSIAKRECRCEVRLNLIMFRSVFNHSKWEYRCRMNQTELCFVPFLWWNQTELFFVPVFDCEVGMSLRIWIYSSMK